MKKIILFIEGIETQEYFSKQLAKTFRSLGHEIFLFQLLKERESFIKLYRFIEKENTVMLTFNFHGLCGEECFYKENKIFWEEQEIPCYNIVLDHPFYYHKFGKYIPPDYTQISIDRGHENYMKRFFPSIKLGPFLPLAGSKVRKKGWEERRQDIVFTGNYTPPQKFNQYVDRIDEEYREFYQAIIDDLILHPSIAMEEAFEKHLVTAIPGICDEDLKVCMENMIFIDLYVRFYFRGLVVKTLVDYGYPVHVYGSGWNLLECIHPENLIVHGPQDSIGCLKAIADSRISLNVMPWFKDGAHDRVFNSMLNGAVCLSDDSKWMRENLEEGKEIVCYSLEHVDELPVIVSELLKQPERMKEIAYLGFKKANTYHTWGCRARILSDLFEILNMEEEKK